MCYYGATATIIARRRKAYEMKRKFSQTRIIALGYLIVIITGAVLLALPAASRDGESAGAVNALFTAASASCVTGLVVLDTATSWTLFGQIVIIALIQVGGLGFMTIATMFSMLLKRKIGVREKSILVESVNMEHIGGIMTITRKIIAGTAIFEGVGAILLATRFIPRFGFLKGAWYGVFHSVSAFCNAGFDLMGVSKPYVSLCEYSSDVVVNLTVCALIIVGGIGFLVWDDVGKKKLKFKYYQLHTKLVLTVTFLLLTISTVLFLAFERDFTSKGLGFGERLLNAFFISASSRTAGFNTVNAADMSPASKLLTIFLMFIGGSPGSTAGGIKTTTLAVIAISTFNGLARRQSQGIFGRRLTKDAIHRASSATFMNITLSLCGIIAVCFAQPDLSPFDVTYECISAIGTVGLSTGITCSLSTFSRLTTAFLMLCGRVGSVSFALALMEKRAAPPIKNPRENITIG